MRYFERKKSMPKAFDIYGWDTEDDSKGNLVGICLYDVKNNDSKFFEKPIQFFKEINRRKYSGSVFCAHNAEYDILNLVRTKIEKFSKYVQFDGKFKYAVYQISEGHTIKFIDTTNYFPFALEKLGKEIDLPKFTDPGLNESWKTRQTYCQRDAEITGKFAEILQKHFISWGTSLRATNGGSAIELFQRRFLRADGEWKALQSWQLEYFRKSYHGGRTECFRLGLINPLKVNSKLDPVFKGSEGEVLSNTFGKIYHYDINSLYPYVMHTTKFPHPDYLLFRKDPEPVCLEYEGASNVTVKVNDDFPVLPFAGKKLIFPNGTFRGTYTNNLLRWAIEHTNTKILKIHSTLSATKSDYYLRDYVSFLYNKRLLAQESGNKPMDLVCKLLMNNLYGRFGMTGHSSEWDSETKNFVQNENETLPPSTNVIWAAMIPSGGYCVMRPYFTKYTLYTDTDSLHTLKKLDSKMVGSSLGQMKLEGEYDEEKILLPKYYYSVKDGKVEYCAKGFPKKVLFDGKETYPQQEAFANGKAFFRRPLRLRECLRSGKRPNVWVETHKTIRAEYDKRQVSKNGKTKPLVICESEMILNETAEAIKEEFNYKTNFVLSKKGKNHATKTVSD